MGDRSDPRSDTFALGVMLYLFATGTHPFGERESARALRKRLYREPAPPRALRGDIPPSLQEVILRCLEVDPDRRYDTAAQVAFDLAHPGEVRLSERAERASRGSLTRRAKRWLGALVPPARVRRSVARHLAMRRSSWQRSTFRRRCRSWRRRCATSCGACSSSSLRPGRLRERAQEAAHRDRFRRGRARAQSARPASRRAEALGQASGAGRGSRDLHGAGIARARRSASRLCGRLKSIIS